ncbi:Isochorismatase hydrolase [Macroventuria anomochaeta]|uniref:Isochorismatase hydrolase n=1 Tax=Macroventuria anomochaeta TaxID=301207 RepID=A0ACB6RSB7_9PLEO|nr:Isochorismatase hydrolase [Macroventuria anomochaeta]KAF2624806.1 Isochorismatase hydrolase [Macroventuria anomochaeta]
MTFQVHHPPEPHRKALIGSKSSFWLHSSRCGFDLIQPSSASTLSSSPKINLPITMFPPKSALVIIDMQNFFLSSALGRKIDGVGHKACKQLIEHAMSAARKAKMRVVWVNWDVWVYSIPSSSSHSFSFEGEEVVASGEVAGSVGVDKHGKERKNGIYKGIGSSLGPIKLESGEEVDGGRLLMRSSWNASLYPPLQSLFEEGQKLENRPDQFFEKEGITTLLFAGVNTDQCVGGTLTDAFSKGYDCILLSDGCETSSPGFAQEFWEYNAAHIFGFCTGCEDLARRVAGIES